MFTKSCRCSTNSFVFFGVLKLSGLQSKQQHGARFLDRLIDTIGDRAERVPPVLFGTTYSSASVVLRIRGICLSFDVYNGEPCNSTVCELWLLIWLLREESGSAIKADNQQPVAGPDDFVAWAAAKQIVNEALSRLGASEIEWGDAKRN